MAVSSTSQFARWEYLSWFSNRGPEVAVAAPGGSILSTLPLSANATGHVGYGRLSGTSMAAPFVTGEATLLFAQHPDWTAQQVYNRIISTADVKNGGRNQYYGWGRINIGRAVSL
jgi:subtilisin family serine protease